MILGLIALPLVSTVLPQASAVPVERVIGSGTADSTGAQGAKWRRINFVAQQSGMATIRLSWTGTADLRFNLQRADGSIIGGNTTASTVSPKTYSSALVTGTTYGVAVWAVSGVGAFTLSVVEDVPDTQAPSMPVGLNAATVSDTSVQLQWDASSDNVAVSGYRVYRDGSQVGLSTTPQYLDNGLQEATAYTYQVAAFDISENVSSLSSAIVVTTSSNTPDTSPPTAPTNLASSSQTSTSIALAWTAATDDRAVTNYYVYRNGSMVGTVNSLSFTDTGLQPDTMYVYSVVAADAAGNLSPDSQEVTVATLPIPTSRPNIVLINTDDQRADTIEHMPKLQQWLVDGGTTFTNGYVSTPSCCPSRATLMSGRYVHNNGQYGQQTTGFNLDLTTQRYLKDAGYFTGHSGKFLHWLPLGTVAPHWDRWTYFKGGYDNVWMRWDNQTVQSNGYSTTITFDRAVDYARDFENRNDDTPFYMSIAPIAPHSPTTPEPKYASTAVEPLELTPAHSETDKSDKPNFVRNRNTTTASANSTKTAQVRTLLSVDDQIDRFMKELEALGELDNTLVIYTSDNGYHWAEHGLTSKFLPYQESVNVPFIVRWPGHVAAGATDNRFVTHVDVAPTVLAAAGASQNQVAFDGKDILSGYNRPAALTEYYYDTSNGNSIPTWAAMTTDSYVYVEYYSTNNNRVTPTFREYYDMVTDPYQLQNLLGDTSTANDPNVTALSAQLGALKDCSGLTCQ